MKDFTSSSSFPRNQGDRGDMALLLLVKAQAQAQGERLDNIEGRRPRHSLQADPDRNPPTTDGAAASPAEYAAMDLFGILIVLFLAAILAICISPW
ncbi:hypothetical protein ACLOJK_032704 [Asimina triloba]